MTELQKNVAAARLQMADRYKEASRRQHVFRIEVLPAFKENMELEFACFQRRKEIELKKADHTLTRNQARRKAHKFTKQERRPFDSLVMKMERDESQHPYQDLDKEAQNDIDQIYNELVMARCPEIIDPDNKKARALWQKIDEAWLKNETENLKSLAGQMEVTETEVDETYLKRILENYRKASSEENPQQDELAFFENTDDKQGVQNYIQQLLTEADASRVELESLDKELDSLFEN